MKALLTQDYWSPISTSRLYRPFTKLTYLFNYAILGSDVHPATYHVVNFLLHALNIALVYFLALAIFRELESRTLLALGMAAIWSVHPVLTEAVTNIVGARICSPPRVSWAVCSVTSTSVQRTAAPKRDGSSLCRWLRQSASSPRRVRSFCSWP